MILDDAADGPFSAQHFLYLSQTTANLNDLATERFKELDAQRMSRLRLAGEHILHGAIKIAEALTEQHRQVLPAAATFMQDRGWWLLPMFRLRTYQELLADVESIDKTDLSDAIVRYFQKKRSRRLSQLVDKWSHGSFLPYRATFAHALVAHRM